MNGAIPLGWSFLLFSGIVFCMSSQFGKWSEAGVPHRGWECVEFEDLGELAGVCEMCETQEIRYVHYMQHAEYPEVIGAGCECAARMAEDYEGTKRRELNAKNAASRRGRWLTREWRTSSGGNPYIRTDGFVIVVFESDGKYKALVDDKKSGRKRFSHRTFDSEAAAKLAAFDAMVRFKTEWRVKT